MRFARLSLLLLAPLAFLVAQSTTGPGDPLHVPTYTADGRMLPPKNYREWIYLSSGLDMSYTPRGRSMGTASDATQMHMFDNVFVNPEAYRAFQATGTWPDKTMLALESRTAQANASINKGGHSQGAEVMAVELHVKDASRGGWAFYEFDGAAGGMAEGSAKSNTAAKKVPLSADCYSCHRDHAAVDTTFAQFYPTLLPLAKQKGTLSASYRKETEGAR